MEPPRTDPPNDPAWRADAFGQSHHTRWADELRARLDDRDPERAREICAAVTRGALRDLAPAVILLSDRERRRAQALGAYALTLFDFAHQTGLEGERLAQINRLEFDLEATLDGDPPGQPAFVALAETGPWPREPLDEILAAARRRVVNPRPASAEEAAAEARGLGSALAAALGVEGDSAATLAGALLRVTDLLGLAEGVRRHRPRVPRDAYPDDWTRTEPDRAALERAVCAECEALRRVLDEPFSAYETRTQRRAARYLRASAAELTRAAARQGAQLLDGPPSLGPWTRLRLLAAAWVRG